MTRYGTTVLVAATLGMVASLGGCSDSPCVSCPPPPPSSGLIASDPILSTLSASSSAAGQSLSAGDSTVYVALFPGTVPGGSLARVQVVGRVDPVITSVVDGGFDPVPIFAGLGDSIEVVVTDQSGAVVKRLGVAVSARRPPVVVRTEPPPKKRDHPLNAAIVVVFSEPVVANSLTSSSVQLFRGSTQVAGSVSLLQGTGSAAAFTPDAALSPNTDYRLVVTQAVRDREGDALAAGVTVPFTTGQSSTGAPASIMLSPDTVYLTGATYQMTATVRDAAGNQLIDQPVTWSSSDPSGLAVSATGLLTARTNGHYVVSATVNGLQAVTDVIVTEPPASVEMLPTSATVSALDTIMLSATVRNAAGQVLAEYPPMTWVSSAPAVATVAPSSYGSGWATVTGVSPGSATITATTGAARGTVSITVTPTRPVASVTITPSAASLVVQGTVQLTSTLLDAQGKVIEGRTITWASNNLAAATVDSSGLVTGVSAGSALVSATSEGVSGTAAITVTTVSFATLSAGAYHTCGVTTTGAAYCWGDNSHGQLGTGSISTSALPVAVAGGLTFSMLTTGGWHTCGLTTGGAAYCWGANLEGELGDGSTTSSPVPVPVSGGLAFSALTAGLEHSCGLTTRGTAYCWGINGAGQLGDGSITFSSLIPVAVTGGLTFSALTAGLLHTCGLTTSGAAYCWGRNLDGELGDGSTTSSAAPVAVTGGLTFAALTARSWHSCGLTTAGAVYCWGNNDYGQLGTGSTTPSTVPIAVVGGQTFSVLALGGTWTGGGDHTCGVAADGAAYCWGMNSAGQLGDGTNTGPEVCTYPLNNPCSQTPVLVTGGLTFSALSVGNMHTCGLATNGAAYCWGGEPWSGAVLGNGSTPGSTVPVKVAGQP